MAISCSSRCSCESRRQQVAGDLLADEPVVRLVGVEGVDDVVAIAPGVRIGDVARRAGRFGVAGHVEPVPAPAFAERRRGQQPIDHLLERVGRLRPLRKASISRRRRRQAGQVERHPADERQPVGVGDRLQPLRFQPGQDETVDVVARPGGVA